MLTFVHRSSVNSFSPKFIISLSELLLILLMALYRFGPWMTMLVDGFLDSSPPWSLKLYLLSSSPCTAFFSHIMWTHVIVILLLIPDLDSHLRFVFMVKLRILTMFSYLFWTWDSLIAAGVYTRTCWFTLDDVKSKGLDNNIPQNRMSRCYHGQCWHVSNTNVWIPEKKQSRDLGNNWILVSTANIAICHTLPIPTKRRCTGWIIYEELGLITSFVIGAIHHRRFQKRASFFAFKSLKVPNHACIIFYSYSHIILEPFLWICIFVFLSHIFNIVLCVFR